MEELTDNDIINYVHKCPTCGHTIKPYKRRMQYKYVGWMTSLVRLAREDNNLYAEYDAIRLRCKKDFKRNVTDAINFLPKLDLIEQHPNSTKSLWRLTPKGIAFMKGKVSVPDIIWIFDNRVVKSSKEIVTIKTLNK